MIKSREKMRTAVRIPIMTLLITVGFTLVSSGVMGSEQNWDFVKFGEKLLVDNPELQKASTLKKAQVAFDAYMDFLTEQKAGITGTLGDSIGHTLEGTRTDPKKVLNCEQHATNFITIFEALAVNEEGKIEGFPINLLTMTKTGPLVYYPLDVNAGHTAILIRDDDGKIYVFDPWMHAMDIRARNPEIQADVFRTGGIFVYEDWETSPYRGMPIEEYEKLVWSKYWYNLEPFDQFRDWQPGQRPEKATPMKPIDDVIDECISFCYGDEKEAKWLISNQYNDRQDPCYLDCINWGVAAMKQMVSLPTPTKVISTPTLSPKPATSIGPSSDEKGLEGCFCNKEHTYCAPCPADMKAVCCCYILPLIVWGVVLR
jgi:hypothetical protein